MSDTKSRALLSKMRIRKGRRSASLSETRSVSPQRAAIPPFSPELSESQVPSQSPGDGGGKPTRSFHRLLVFGRKIGRSRSSRSANPLKTASLSSPLPYTLVPTTPPLLPPTVPLSSLHLPSPIELVEISWDGFTEALKVVKESSDWNPFLKAALGGAVAVINLGKQVKGNWEEMASLLSRIENLQLTLEMHKDTYRPGKNNLSSYVEKCAKTFEKEVAELKDMQTHGKIRRVMQGTRDGDRLLGIYRCIKDSLHDLQYAIGMSIERDIGLIRQSATLDKLCVSWTAAHNAAIGDTPVSRQACTKDTRLPVIKPIIRWTSAPDGAPVYWLTGPAGVGKTTIAQTICRYIAMPTGEYEEAGSKELVERCVVSYFCSHQLDSGESKRLVPTICRRLAEHSSSYARELVRALDSDSTLLSADLKTQLKGLLIKPWESSAAQRDDLPLPVIVVDALDENQGGFEFLDLLLTAVDDHKFVGLRFLVTSRTDPVIATRCQSFPKDVVCRLQEIPKADVQHDINLYLLDSLPKVRDILLRNLTDRAGNLFIYAATVVKMMRGSTGSEQEKIIGKVLGMASTGQSSLLDDLYAGIVHSAIYHPDNDIQRDRLHILHTVLCKRALHVDSPPKDLIYQLSGASDDAFSAVVERLHAVMYTARDGSILTYHSSFSDFILRPPSSFNSSVHLNPLCDEALHHAHLTRRCYEIMCGRLRFNICNLESSFNLNHEIPDLASRVKANIDPVLQYAVRYWMRHLESSRPEEEEDASSSIPLCNIPLAFVDHLFLFWLEALNLIRGLHLILYSTGWIGKHCPEQTTIWQEMLNFCLKFYRAGASASTPHIYISMLSSWKPELYISRMWRPRFPHLPIVARDSSNGPGNTNALGNNNELVDGNHWVWSCGDRWLWSQEGWRIIYIEGHWVPYKLNPCVAGISFDLWYLGLYWTRTYVPTLSQF